MILRRTSIALLFIVLGLSTVASQMAFSVLEFPLIGASGEKIFGAGYVNRVAFTPDGQLITGGSLGALAWDADSGELLSWLARFPLHTQTLNDIAVSADGNLLLTGSRDRTARVWNLATGEPVSATDNLPGDVVAVGFSANGESFFTASGGAIQIWRTSDASLLRSVPLGIRVQWTSFSPRGDRAFAVASIAKDPLGGYFGDASDPKAAFLVNLETGETLPTPFLPANEYIYDADFTSDGTRLAYGNQAGEVKIINLQFGELAAEIIDSASYGLYLKFSPDGSRLATGVRTNQVKIWDVQTQTVIQTLSHNEFVRGLAFSRDGNRLAIRTRGHVQIWDLASAQQINTLDGFAESSSVGYGLLSQDGTRIVGRLDNIITWDAQTGRIIAEANEEQHMALNAISPDGAWMLLSFNGEWSIWDTATLQLIRRVQIPSQSPPSALSSIALSSDGSRVVTTYLGAVSVWNTLTGEKLRDFNLPSENPVQAVFLPNSQEVLILADQLVGSVIKETLWVGNIETGTIALQSNLIFQLGVHYASPVVFSPDRQVFVRPATHPTDSTIPYNEVRTLPLFDTATGTQTRLITQHPNAIYVAAFTPDGQTIAEGGINRAIHIWDWKNAVERKTLYGHTDSVYRLQYSADASLLLSGSFDGTIRLWDTSRSTLTSVSNWRDY